MGSRVRQVWIALGMLTAMSAGCAAPRGLADRTGVSNAVAHRMGMAHPPTPSTGPMHPPGVNLGDGLSEDEAVCLALWNNAAFAELLTDLDLARADAVQAAQLPNPELWLLSPVGVKQLEYAIELPLDALIVRPIRLSAARKDVQRTADVLVQAALNLIRDARGAYADAVLAEDRVVLSREAEQVRKRISRLAATRVKAGDASPIEAATATIDSQRAEQESARLVHDLELAHERLRHVLGIGVVRTTLTLARSAMPVLPVDAEALVQHALASRPDAQAATWAVAAAQDRLELARRDWLRLGGIVDANGRGINGFETGPGLRVILPIFNWNRGRILRAEAELERACRQQVTLRHRIALDVRQAHVQWVQAVADLVRWSGQIRPTVEDAIRKAELSYKEGDTTLLLMLETTRQLLDSRMREAQLQADIRRAAADLDRAVGQRLASPGGRAQP